ncbi:hypothetical protein DW060_13410 [Leyella stercorea]|uniref:Uncharacterized protein n=1 Tax=Leyella stercorea TaxID=363265 RepID=A0A3R6INX5_9BACT|nr:hypothetical protein DW060_13410 [Leyella stercorea]
MNKKIYTAPKINVVEMCCTTIMAGSGEYKIEEDGTGVSGTLGSESVSSGDSWGGAYSASRVYFDSWTDDPDDI